MVFKEPSKSKSSMRTEVLIKNFSKAKPIKAINLQLNIKKRSIKQEIERDEGLLGTLN